LAPGALFSASARNRIAPQRLARKPDSPAYAVAVRSAAPRRKYYINQAGRETAIGQRRALSARAVQYSQARASGLGDRLMAAASLVSPGVNGPRLPSASARIWYSAFWHMAIERKTSSRTLPPTTVAPCRRISTAECGPSARA